MVLACGPGIKVVNGETGRVAWHVEEVRNVVLCQDCINALCSRKKTLLHLLQFHQMARCVRACVCVCVCVCVCCVHAYRCMCVYIVCM